MIRPTPKPFHREETDKLWKEVLELAVRTEEQAQEMVNIRFEDLAWHHRQEAEVGEFHGRELKAFSVTKALGDLRMAQETLDTVKDVIYGRHSTIKRSAIEDHAWALNVKRIDVNNAREQEIMDATGEA